MPTQVRPPRTDVPTRDFFKDHPNVDEGKLDALVDSFVHWLNSDLFLTWEAVVCQETGQKLTKRQKAALGELLSFNDEDDEDDDDGVLYIDEIPRPSEPWHVILNKIVPHLVVQPFDTADCRFDVMHEGWHQITQALKKHGKGLSLPEGATLETVVPADIRHQLWLQVAFDVFSGLGQDPELTLENPEELDRVHDFLDRLREIPESVAYFNLTLESLLTRLILPEPDRPIFVRLVQAGLGLSSPQDLIAPHL